MIAALVAGAAVAHAEDKAKCYTAGGYRVIARERRSQAGSDILVRRLASGSAPACVYAPKAGDFVLADPAKPYWFKDIRSDYLILTESTGPMESVVLFDLPSRRKVLDLTASDIKVDDRGIYFWARTEGGTRETCRNFRQIKAQGLNPVIETKARFIFGEGRMIEIKATRCVASQ